MRNNSVPKFIFHLSRFPVYRGSVLGRFYCNNKMTLKFKTVRDWDRIVFSGGLVYLLC